ncbi:MAG: pSer/pThr/pTyr-binding forkhead associated (FHA) protein [Mariniblastus sp.]|jgi:pSer/pThr/pTyr-binding forkhead associated (FHA) protein
MRYKLQVLNTSAETVEREWILHLPATVGRSPDSDVAIGDASISRRHCQFFLNAEGALSVRDFESMNGTYVDDQKVNKRAVLNPAGVVRIGSVTIKLEWTEEPVTETSRLGQASADSTQPMRVVIKDDLK